MDGRARAVVDGVAALRDERDELLEIVEHVAEAQVLGEMSDGTAVLLPHGLMADVRRLADNSGA